MNIFYEYGDNLYVNLTNECPMNCTFCERQYTDKIGNADSLWLDHEPTMIEVLTELSKWNIMQYKELVFCGFGEPTERMDLVLDVANIVKRHNNIQIRLNTNGLANLINGKDVVPRFKDVIDTVSISMNASNPETYLKITQSEYGIDSFQAMLDFAEECKKYVRRVIMTSVSTTITKEEEEECAAICQKMGVEYVIRPYEDHGSGVFPNADGERYEEKSASEEAEKMEDSAEVSSETEVPPTEESAVSEEANGMEDAAEAGEVSEAEAESPVTEEVSAPEAPAEEVPASEEVPVPEEAPETEKAPEAEQPAAEEPAMETSVQEKPAAPVRPARREEAGRREIKLYLASASPRRKELLSQLGIPFECIASDVTEDTTGKTPGEAAQAIALAKAQAVADQVPGPAVIIGADTLISLHGDIFGKPASEEEAFEMLSELQGIQHRVYTGVAIIIKARAGQKCEQFSDFTKVKMVEMNEKEIWDYIKTGEPMDKAGAYAIQGIGGRYIHSIEGNYTTVVGLPMHLLYAKLKTIRALFPNR